MDFYRQIILFRHFTSTIYSALRLNTPTDTFGIADPTNIRSLSDALANAQSSRDTVAFQVIDSLSRVEEIDLASVCDVSFRGASNCFGAVVFHSSPSEGGDGDRSVWNYTLRADIALGTSFQYDERDNDAELYVLPLQRAVDAAIAQTQQYGFTDETEDERERRIRRHAAFILALVGREKGLSQLIDAMMPGRSSWDRQAARLWSLHYAFTSAYMPGWVVASIMCRAMIWTNTSYGIVVPFFILSGLAMTSMSLIGGALFRKAQLSGPVTAIVWIVFGIIAQVTNDASTGAAAVLGLLFTPFSFVYFIISIARYEREGHAMNLLESAPGSSYRVPGIAFWCFLLAQTLLYPLLAAYLERLFHGAHAGAQKALVASESSGDAVRLQNATKIYRPSTLRRFFSFVSPPRPEVIAVKDLTISAKKGQILALLGANGSGKSTTLDAIAGISRFTSGDLALDTTGGLGIAPQKNVLWDELTVEEHIQIFNQIKCPRNPASKEEIHALIKAIGLEQKTKAQSKTLSGGQKRKLQLGMMLTGGSSICCVDEVSSGIDPLSRKKIWDILLAERGSRTIIMTTHFLDEADLLADNIAILSKGTLRAQGSSVELKNNLGAGYRVHVLDARHVHDSPDIAGVTKKVNSNTIVYVAPSSDLAAQVIRALEAAGIRYQFSGPTIEDVFLNVAEEVQNESGLLPDPVDGDAGFSKERSSSQGFKGPGQSLAGLHSGRQISFAQQTWVLIRKRFIIFKTNWIPYVAAFLIPIIAAALTQMLVSDADPVTCSPANRVVSENERFNDVISSIYTVTGPRDEYSNLNLESLIGSSTGGTGRDISLPASNVTLVNSFSDFQRFIEDNRRDVTPGGWYLGSRGTPPTIAYRADQYSMFTSVVVQNMMNTILTNTSIVASYRPFDASINLDTGDYLQMVVYLGLAFAIFPGLFGFYINNERRMSVRSLQYSSGARSLPLWVAHLAFDFGIALVAVIIAAAIYVGASDVWYNGGLLFPVFILYALASILLTYLISLWTNSALSTYAIASAVQGVGFAAYLIAFLFILTFSDSTVVDRDILIGHWVISIFFPIASLMRAMLVATNAFNISCADEELQPNPGAITAYGGPILYLVVQSIILFALILVFDSGVGTFNRGTAKPRAANDDAERAEELLRVGALDNEGGLRVKHLTKAFGSNTAVDNVSFGVDHGEVFALLGPNGAGKSTTISLIRGDQRPSRNGGDVFIEDISVSKNRAQARQNLGVCPQFDAIDSMTVREHLEHYARLRGIDDVKGQVRAVVEAVGLGAYMDVMAHTLSGGNKRKLSLAIALTGNPSVILLDEPSSGLDAAAKRIMWRTLQTIVPGRSILLTTHSMEEADALATRAGIMARHMLALGTTEGLCRQFGDTLHVHLVAKTAPYSTVEEMEQMRRWVMETFTGAEVEKDTYHGQMRFSIPTSSVFESQALVSRSRPASETEGSAIGQLLLILEENKEALGIAHHSVSPTTLNQVFLTIVGQHDVQEEGYRSSEKKPWYKKTLPELFGR
ncbi:ABC transporter [Stachybotrys elegans]|uniref:ABC transporter n=1 Tax=Stachybotrys elegans TaxID=80388 RepID=A0A8K0SWC5_9HYPO|nr:ABC transporter [Stachybotrys elegans]